MKIEREAFKIMEFPKKIRRSFKKDEIPPDILIRGNGKRYAEYEVVKSLVSKANILNTYKRRHMQ